MSQTLTTLLVHVIFSTKNRARLITPEVEPDLFAVMGGILKDYKSPLLAAGGTSDHVHLLISQSKNIALSMLLQEIKKSSSSWIKSQGEEFQSFHWQDGYAGFSVGRTEVANLKRYIASQKTHHQKQTFQEELIQFLDEYGVEYDERYLWR